MNKDTLKVLEKAKFLLTSVGWSKGSYAKDKTGHACHINSNDVRSYCSVGAIVAARLKLQIKGEHYASVFLRQVIKGITIPSWNDARTTTKDDVIDAFDRAILRAGGDPTNPS